MEKALIYFDSAATTAVFSEVAEAMFHSLQKVYGNPSSIHEVGRHARVEVERARRSMARLVNAQPGEVFFTSGGTEAINAVLWGCFRDHSRKHFITSRLEHPAVLQTLVALEKYQGCCIQFVQTDDKGVVDLNHLEQLLENNPGAVVSLMHANNEIGNLLPVKEVGALCSRFGALFFCDTVQTAGKLALDLGQLPFDFAVLSAHKFHGPKGVGVMYVRSGRSFGPFVAGGAQERNMRAGTENVPGIVGMARAFELVHADMEPVANKIEEIRTLLISQLSARIPGIGFNGDTHGSSIHSILNVSLPPGIDADLLLPRLDLAGICVSTGSACSSGSNKPSHVLKALGIDQKIPNLRISFSRFNTLAEAERLVEVLEEICKK